MSLLVDMMTDSLDASYADAARRRQGESAGGAGADPASSRRNGLSRRGIAVVLLIALGLVTGTAAAQVRKRQQAGNSVRAQLVAEVGRRTAESDALADQAARLRREVGARQDAALQSNSAGVQVSRQLAALRAATGLDPVTGPGLVVRLEDAPASEGTDADRGGQIGSGRVLDRDLQDAVNGLWSAGAEAVAINGLRLTSLTAIRSAGEAILVDFRPIARPYMLAAIGAAGIDKRLADSATGKQFKRFVENYRMVFEIKARDGLTLPAGADPGLRYATPPPSAPPSGPASASPSGSRR